MLKITNKCLTLFTAAVLSVGALASSASFATAFTDADKAVEYRQQALQLIRENFAFMASMVRGDRDYDGELFEQRAEALYHLSYVPWDGFKHAGYQHSGNGDALPAVWENWDDFEERSEQLKADAKALAEAAASYDMNDIRPLFMSAARNCQQCHENYRAD